MADPQRRRPGWKNPLFGTILVSAILLFAVSGWLFTDERTSRSEALKTGGLAGGAVVALYALWLNDRRRQVEERRQAVEQERYSLESERVADDRFAKAVELLGHNTDQVRVGALHALAGLARNRPRYRQTVLDVLCAYLRRPFDHPRFREENEQPSVEDEQELTVRLTAQRLIADLLPDKDSTDAEGYDLDLTGACLEYFELRRRRIGKLTIRYARLYSTTTFRECEFLGPVWFTEAGTGSGRLAGRFHCPRTVFRDRAWFSGMTFGGLADFEGCRFVGETSFKNAEFSGQAILRDTTFDASLDLKNTEFKDYADLRFAKPSEHPNLHNTLVNTARGTDLPDAWKTEALADGRTRVVSANGR